MERLVIDTEGRIAIPPEILQRRGLHPGDELTVLETGRGLLVCQDGLALLDDWWESLTEEEKVESRQEADAYEALSEEARDAIWNEGSEEFDRWFDADDDEDDEEGDALDLAASQQPASQNPIG